MKALEILNKFTSESSRAWCREVQREGKYLFASNLEWVARIKSDIEVRPENVRSEKKTKIKDLFSYKPKLKLNRDILEAINEIPKSKHNVIEAAKCEDCDGLGYVDWEFNNYTMEANCPVCRGRGENGSRITGTIDIPDRSYGLRMKTISFDPFNFKKILDAVKGEPYVGLDSQDNLRIDIGEFEFLLSKIMIHPIEHSKQIFIMNYITQ